MSESQNPGGAVVAAFSGGAPQPSEHPKEQPFGHESQRRQEANRQAGADIFPTGDREALQSHYGSLKQKLANGTATLAEKREHSQLTQYLHFGGEVPDSMKSTYQANPDSEYSATRDAVAGAYTPASDPSEYHATGTLPPEVTDWARGAAQFLGLPADNFKMFEKVIDAHFQDGGPETVDESNQEAWLDALADCYKGGLDEAAAQIEKARAFISATRGPQALANLDKSEVGRSSLMFEPRLINRLASLYQVHFGGGE